MPKMVMSVHCKNINSIVHFEMTKRDSSLTVCMITYMQYLKKTKIKTYNRVIKIWYRLILRFICLSVILFMKINLILWLFIFLFHWYHNSKWILKWNFWKILRVLRKSNCREYFSKQTSPLVSSIYETNYKH